MGADGAYQTPQAGMKAGTPPADGASYGSTLSRVETYFDQTATRTWERLTSDAPVSRIRETVRRGRDDMRARMLDRLPNDLTGARILDAGCGTGAMTTELARRGAEVVAVDISPALIGIAQSRLPETLRHRVTFHAGDMLDDSLGYFDHVMAMDSLIYYRDADIARSLACLMGRTSERIVFTVAPRTTLLMAMWYAGKLFPRSDRSPTMIPHSPKGLVRAYARTQGRGTLAPLGRVTSGFYISHAMEVTG